MKRKHLFTCVIALLGIYLSNVTSSLSYNPGTHAKTAKAKSVTQADHFASFDVVAYAMPADLPTASSFTEVVASIKVIPVDDPKPDNINWQLIRQDQLKLHWASNDKSC